MILLNHYKVGYGNLPIENKFKKIVFNKHKITPIDKKIFLIDKLENVNAFDLITEFNKIDRLFVFMKEGKKVHSKIYKRSILTFLNDNFLNYLFLNKIFQWFFFFVKKFNKKKISKEVLDFFFSKLLLKNMKIFFYDDFFKLSFNYNNFLKKYFHIFFLTLNGKKNWRSKKFSGYHKNRQHLKSKYYFIKNNKKKKFRLFNMRNNINNTTNVGNNLYLKLFFLGKKKKFKSNLNVMKIKGVRLFLRKKKFWYYKLRFKKYWYSKKYLFMRKYNRQKNKTFFHLDFSYKLCQNFNKGAIIRKFMVKPKKNYYQLKFFYKFKLNFFFKKIKSNLSFFFNFFSKNNYPFFHSHEKFFLLLLEASHYKILSDYFYPRIPKI